MIDSYVPKKVSMWRVIRLYRHAVGWKWWLQRGRWYDCIDTAMAIACGVQKRRFIVDYEEPHDNRESAEQSRKHWDKTAEIH